MSNEHQSFFRENSGAPDRQTIFVGRLVMMHQAMTDPHTPTIDTNNEKLSDERKKVTAQAITEVLVTFDLMWPEWRKCDTGLAQRVGEIIGGGEN